LAGVFREQHTLPTWPPYHVHYCVLQLVGNCALFILNLSIA
jgi:hypothetical protein